MGDGDQLVSYSIQGTEDIKSLSPRACFDKQAFKAPQKSQIGTEDKMRCIPKENSPFACFCLL